jgi:protein phosphatase
MGFGSDVGRVRENNEDYLLFDAEIQLSLVADGVGGHYGGDIASELAAKTIQGVIKDRLNNRGDPYHSETAQRIPSIIQEAIGKAHEAILQRASGDMSLSSMATTIVLGLCCGEHLYIAHVGDSRAYLINKKKITQLTADHSLVANLLKQGQVTKKEAENHILRHVITQCLGCTEYQGPDITIIDWHEGDIFLFCTDGLTDAVDDYNIIRIIHKNRHDLQSGAESLIDFANRKGGADNITVILTAYSA